MSHEAPATDYGFLADALDAADADAFVHVGGDGDADLRYLSRLSGSTHEYAFVYTDEAVLCAPPDAPESITEQFPGRVVRDDADTPAGKRAVAVLDDADSASATVLVPRHLPHDAAVYLQWAGYDLTSTSAVTDARAVKSATELDRLRVVQRAATRGMARVRTVLSEAHVESSDSALHWEGGPLSTERLRRQVNARLATEGVAGTEHTRVHTGANASDFATELRAGDPVVVVLAPRGLHGYHGVLTRTFVVDSDGGWERRAHVGVDAARRVALSELEPGESLQWVHSETVAEASSFGLTPPAGDRVHGVGLERREAPSLTEEAKSGHVVAIRPAATDVENGTVALADLAVVTEEGCELLVDASTSLVP